DRQYGLLFYPGKDEARLRRSELEHAFFAAGRVLTLERQRQGPAARLADQAQCERNVHRLLVALPRCRRNSLAELERIVLGRRIVNTPGMDFGRAGL